MSAVTVVMVIFSMLGAADRMLGNRFGLGKEFEKGFLLFGNMALSMIGMIVISPLIAELLRPAFDWVWNVMRLDPSIIPASLFANDMGGAPLAVEVAKDAQIGMYNALVTSAMMGCTVSFVIPYALSAVEPRQHRELLLGLLCGIVTIPAGCFASGLLLRLPMGALLRNLLPLTIFSGIIATGLMLFPNACVRVFSAFGVFIKVLITVGLALSILKFLTGIELISGLETLEEGAAVCLNASAVMTGAFPLMFFVSKVLAMPIKRVGSSVGINETSAMGMVATLASSIPTFEMMKDMDRKGVMLNSAFIVSACGAFAGHLAFTMAFNAEYLPAVILGKLTAAFLALLVAQVMHKRIYK